MPDDKARAFHSCCHHGRRFFTKEERIQQLEKYREQLQKELQGVEEHLKEQK
jgi:hypothetical protein